MSFSRTHILIADQFNNGIPAGGSTSLSQPPNLMDWPAMYDELTWTISVIEATGSPSAWSLTARFLYRQMHAGTTYRFQTPRYYEPSTANIQADIAEGVGWYGPNQIPPVAGGPGIIANQTTDLSAPLVISRTMRNLRPGTRVDFGLSFTGGTSPRLKFGLEVTGRKK